MKYEIEFTNKAEKLFKKLAKAVQRRLARKIDSLVENPRGSNVKKLSGEENVYRLRDGDYRIVYAIYDAKLLVVIVKIGHRREVYR